MDTPGRRALAGWTGAFALLIAGGILWFWWKHSGGGPGDIGLALVTLSVAGLQLIPAAGLFAVVWTRSRLARFVLVVFAVLLGASSLYLFAIPLWVALGATIFATRALLGGSRRFYAVWLTISAVFAAVGVGVLGFLFYLS